MPQDPKAQWTAVDHYLDQILLTPDPILDAALKANEAGGLPSIDVAPNQGKLLQLLAQAQGARRILEIGALGGYSTICLARALPPGGRLTTLEVNPKHAAVALSNIARAGFASVVDLRLGPALDTLIQLVEEQAEPFDFVFIDADKPSYTDYLRWALKLTRPGSLILADNVVRDGIIADPSTTDPAALGARRFLEALGSNPRVESVALQTVGSKGYDGFALARVLSL